MSTSTTESPRVPYAQALEVAEELVRQMRPFCEKIEIAGSLRRRKPDVGDIEIVAVPIWGTGVDTSSLFQEEVDINLLYREWAQVQKVVRWIKPGSSSRVDWHANEDGRYWRGHIASLGINLDIFLTEPGNYGAQLLIRTGDWMFSKEVVTHARRVGYRFEDGFLRYGSTTGRCVMTPDEQTVFRHLGLEYVQPEERTGAAAVRSKR